MNKREKLAYCSCCKKEIPALSYNYTDYVYKIGCKYFCSWSCMQDFRRTKNQTRKYNNVKLNREYSVVR